MTKTEQVREELKKNPNRTNQQIADKVGCDNSVVSRARSAMNAGGKKTAKKETPKATPKAAAKAPVKNGVEKVVKSVADAKSLKIECGTEELLHKGLNISDDRRKSIASEIRDAAARGRKLSDVANAIDFKTPGEIFFAGVYARHILGKRVFPRRSGRKAGNLLNFRKQIS